MVEPIYVAIKKKQIRITASASLSLEITHTTVMQLAYGKGMDFIIRVHPSGGTYLYGNKIGTNSNHCFCKPLFGNHTLHRNAISIL